MGILIQHPRVHLDFGAISVLPAELAALGIRKPLFITDKGLVQAGVFATVQRALGTDADYAVYDEVPENPTIEGVERALETYSENHCDGIVAVGGGSVIDTSKAVSVVATHPGSIEEYFGHPEKITPATAPIIAVPTTAGTGSETSRGAGIHHDAASRGHGINSTYIVPRVAICDPDLTLTLPKHLTAGTGMDALSHALEGYFAKADNPHGDAIALDSIARVCAWIDRAVTNGADREARWHMMLAALQAMMVAKGLGPAHALANTFGDQGLHHGMMVTISLPAMLRRYETVVPEKTARVAEAMGLENGTTPAEAVAEMNERLGIPATMRALGYKGGDLEELATDAHNSWFNHAAPWHPSVDEYKDMISEMLE